MTDLEYEIIDELYFVISFQELKEQLEISAEELLLELDKMIRKGWVKVFTTDHEDVEIDAVDFSSSYQLFNYLASKKGLMIHNS